MAASNPISHSSHYIPIYPSKERDTAYGLKFLSNVIGPNPDADWIYETTHAAPLCLHLGNILQETAKVIWVALCYLVQTPISFIAHLFGYTIFQAGSKKTETPYHKYQELCQDASPEGVRKLVNFLHELQKRVELSDLEFIKEVVKNPPPPPQSLSAVLEAYAESKGIYQVITNRDYLISLNEAMQGEYVIDISKCFIRARSEKSKGKAPASKKLEKTLEEFQRIISDNPLLDFQELYAASLKKKNPSDAAKIRERIAANQKPYRAEHQKLAQLSQELTTSSEIFSDMHDIILMITKLNYDTLDEDELGRIEEIAEALPNLLSFEQTRQDYIKRAQTKRPFDRAWHLRHFLEKVFTSLQRELSNSI